MRATHFVVQGIYFYHICFSTLDLLKMNKFSPHGTSTPVGLSQACKFQTITTLFIMCLQNLAQFLIMVPPKYLLNK